MFIDKAVAAWSRIFSDSFKN